MSSSLGGSLPTGCACSIVCAGLPVMAVAHWARPDGVMGMCSSRPGHGVGPLSAVNTARAVCPVGADAANQGPKTSEDKRRQAKYYGCQRSFSSMSI